jgi:hypothetical protein
VRCLPFLSLQQFYRCSVPAFPPKGGGGGSICGFPAVPAKRLLLRRWQGNIPTVVSTVGAGTHRRKGVALWLGIGMRTWPK